MKKFTLILLFFICFGNVVFAQNKSGDRTVFGKTINPETISPSGYIRCASNEYEEYLRSQNPKMETRAQFEDWMAQKIEEQKFMSQSGGIIYIPVVVHVIHNGDAYGVNENISDEQVQSQITVMNQDFRRMASTPGFNSNPVGADVQVEFVLAKVDPNGNPTNGINRVNLCRTDWNGGSSSATSALVNAEIKPVTIWNPTLYMNMWSVNFGSSGLLGYAQFPETTLAGMSTAAQNANTDGVVANFGTFGSRTLVPTGNFSGTLYDKGRTMTHEVGHYLGLRHIWGDDACSGTTNVATNEDFVADTPAAGAANYGCATGTDSCPSVPLTDMVENYMDYSDDACMNIFTAGQKTRITTVLNNSPRRNFAASTKDVAIALFANDAEVIIENSCSAGTAATCAAPNPVLPLKMVSLYNRGTSALTAATLSYNVDGGTNYIYNWTGSLASDKYAAISLPNTGVNGTLNVTITAANGTDQRASNNTASKVFAGGTSTIPYHNYTTFTFNLVGDRYGAETSWTLKNAAGATLFQGGPYTNLAANGTQNLVTNLSMPLAANGCYYLTVSDSWGDGITPTYGSGYYTLTANSGAVSVINETSFTGPGGNVANSKVHYFTNNAVLASDSFSLIEDVTLYPNPSKDFFTIDVPQGITRTGKMEVYNNLGQRVITKVISSDADLNVNVSNLTNGVYFLNLNLGDAIKTLRFIKE
jgi:hypothetical protein